MKSVKILRQIKVKIIIVEITLKIRFPLLNLILILIKRVWKPLKAKKNLLIELLENINFNKEKN